MIDILGSIADANVMKSKKEIIDTCLLLAIGSHQELVVKKMLDMSADVNQPNMKVVLSPNH